MNEKDMEEFIICAFCLAINALDIDKKVIYENKELIDSFFKDLLKEVRIEWTKNFKI